ncbi:MAG: M16 family metallopeptidase [Acidobacteriota bacterium]
MMGQRETKIAAGAALVWVLAVAMVISVAGQSGRGRTPAPTPPKPQPVPKVPVAGPTVLGIPEGGKLARQDGGAGTGRFILRNQLTAVIRERHSVPLVAVEVAVRVGWADEPAGSAGIARLVQELLVSGPAVTESAGGKSIEQEVARLGGRMLARVDGVESAITIVIPAESYVETIGILAGMLGEPDFSAAAIERAWRRLELREKAHRAARGADDRRLDEVARLLGKGEIETAAEKFPTAAVAGFYRRFYQPGNMVVAVAGDIFSLPALGQIQLKFGLLAGTGNGVAPVAALSEGRPYHHERAGISQSVVTIGYRLPAWAGRTPSPAELKERAVADVLAAVLGLGRGSRLYQGLRDGLASRDKASVAVAVRAWRETGPGRDWLIAQLEVDPERIDRAEAEWFREIERMRREVISEGELRRAITMLEKRHYDALETIEGEVGRLASSQLLDGDYRLVESALSRQQKVTAVEVQQAAARYLVINQMAVRELETSKGPGRTFTPEKFAELIVTFAPGAAQAVREEEVKPATVLKTFQQGPERLLPVNEQNVVVAPIPLPVRDFSVLRGPRAFVREDKSRPIVTVTIVFQGGRLQETSATSGTTELMLRSMLRSTTSRKADLIAHELESYGADVRIVNEADFYGFSIEVLSRNTEAAVKLLLEIIESPFFDREEVARERAILAAEQQGAADALSATAREYFLGAIFPGHPYSLPRYGRLEVISKLTVEQLEDWHTKTIRRQYPFVFLVGDTDGSSMVSRIFSDGLKRGDLDKTLKVSMPTQFPPSQDRIGEAGWMATWQANGFRIGNQAFTTPIDHLGAAMLAELIRSGGWMNEIRQRQSLVNGVEVGLEQYLAGSFFRTEMVTRPEQETAALDLLSRELQRLVGSQPTDEEFELARNAAIGRYAIALQSNTERTFEYARAALIGRKPADVEGQPEAMIGVRKSDLKRIAESIFKNSAGGRGVLRGTKAPTP